MKVFVLTRMWDSIPRGHETVETISTDAETLMNFVRWYACCGPKAKYSIDESFDDVNPFWQTDEEIVEFLDQRADSNGQWFLHVKGYEDISDSESLNFVDYRIQIRNVHSKNDTHA